MASTLQVVVDGVPLDGDRARTFWQRYSAWMEEHAGDLAGFARSEGLASMHPEMHAGAPVLVGSRTEPQLPYAPAAARPRKPARAPRRRR